jgi:hypothetical protein
MGKRVGVKRSTNSPDSREFAKFGEAVAGWKSVGGNFAASALEARARAISALRGADARARDAHEGEGEGGAPAFGGGECGGVPACSAAARITAAAFPHSTE